MKEQAWSPGVRSDGQWMDLSKERGQQETKDSRGRDIPLHSVMSQGSWLHLGGMCARTATHTSFQCSILREFEKGVWASHFAVLCCERGSQFLSARGTLLGGKWAGWQWTDFMKRLEGEQLILWMVTRMRGNKREKDLSHCAPRSKRETQEPQSLDGNT